MKSILVTTDFSTDSKNAINYAAEMAFNTRSTLILANIYCTPFIIAESPAIIPEYDNIEQEALETLAEIKCSLRSRYGNSLNIKCIGRIGTVMENSIMNIASEEGVDFIVIGMQKAGYFEEKLIGNAATALIRRSKCPVLIINSKVRFKPIRKIVLACDYKEMPDIDAFMDIIKLYNSTVYVLNIVPEMNHKKPGSIRIMNQIREKLKGIDHSFDIWEDENTINGINGFVRSVEANLVILTRHKHTFPGNIFHKSSTREMAFHATIPLLAIHE
jgi:nucleotide-binding universal stress UspA family protein